MAFWQCYYHLVWATKNRAALITPELEPILFGYTVNRAAEHEVMILAINGWTDHLHVVASIPPKQAVADLVKSLKGASAHYLNHLPDRRLSFAWQQGYGVLTFSAKNLDAAISYVQLQKEHHNRQTANPWLERYAESDEGPVRPGLAGVEQVKAVREEEVTYGALGELPF